MSAPPPRPGAPSGPPAELPPAAYRDLALLLRVGLGIALTTLLVSLGAFMIAHGTSSSSTFVDSNPIAGFLSWGGLGAGLASGNVEAYLTLGLLVLIATPVARVFAGCYYLERNHDRMLAGIALVVFLMLLVGLLVIGPLIR